MRSRSRIIVVGGGAAGFFSALILKESYPNCQITILEKTKKLLSKVKVSGGGRCNITHACFIPRELVKNYPRGQKELKSVFSRFQPGDVIEWFSNNGVELKTEEDGRMFPITDSSQTIIDCFINKSQELGIEIETGKEVLEIRKKADEFEIHLSDNTITCDYLIIASGGGNKIKFYEYIQNLTHSIKGPLPSLFTFNIKDVSLHELKGLSFQDIEVKVEGTKMKEVGDLLITHWGISGPGVLKLSAFGAEWMAENNYDFWVNINWIGYNQEQAYQFISDKKNEGSKSLVHNDLPGELPSRMRHYIIDKSEIPAEKRTIDLSKKEINKLVQNLCNCRYPVNGTTTFKEEFVTCGGVSLKEIDFKTMESKLLENLYFAGEVIDIDGVTGGFNFQNAWSTAFIAAKAIESKLT